MVVRSLLTLLGFDVDEKKINKYNKTLKTVTRTTQILAVGTAAMAAAFLKGAGDIEQTTIAFETMLGSAEEADQLIKEITQFAAKTPFELTGLLQSSKQLLAFGIEAEKIIPTMTNLGNIAAGVGRDKLPSIILAFGKIRTKGKATMEELNILLEAGVPILDALAENLGVSTKEIAKLVSKGVVGFEDVDNALAQLSTGNGRFANLMEKQSKSFLGIVSNILDFLTNLRNEIGAKLLPAAKSLASGFLEFLEANQEIIKSGVIKFFRGVAFAVAFVFLFVKELINRMGGLSNIIKTVVGAGKVLVSIFAGLFKTMRMLLPILIPLASAMLAYKAVLIVLAAKTLILKAVTLAQAVAQGILNAVLIANPIGLVIAGIAALIAIGILVVKNWDKIKKAAISLWKTIKRFFARIWNILSDLLDNPFIVAAGLLLSPWVTIPLLIIKHWERIKTFFINLWGGIVRTFKTAISFLANSASMLWTSFLELLDSPIFRGLAIILAPFLTIPTLVIKNWEPLKEFFINLWDTIKTTFSNAKETISTIIDAIVGFAGTIKEAFSTAFNRIKDLAGNILEFGEKIAGVFGRIKGFIFGEDEAVDVNGSVGNTAQSTIDNRSNNFSIRSNVTVGVPAGTPEEQQRQVEQAARRATQEEWNNIMRNTLTDMPAVDFTR